MSDILPFSFEIYTHHPKTKQPGWAIKCGHVINATSRDMALERIKAEYPHFDTVVGLHQVAGFNGNEEGPYLDVNSSEPITKIVIALDKLNDLIRLGYEYPDAEWRVSQSFKVPYRSLRRAYDHQPSVKG